MIARISTYHILPGREAEVVETLREQAVPGARRQVGFRGLLHLVDENDGKAVTISFWESREAALRSESGGFYPTQVANVIPFLSAPPVREFFDVRIDER